MTDTTHSNGAKNYRKPVGAYVPPAKRVKAEKFDVGSEDHQRLSWDEHKKKITRLINQASATNVTLIIKQLFDCNLIRYKGLFATSLLKAQETSPKFTDVYAAILSVINSRVRTIGLLVVNRLVLQFRVAFVNNNKSKCLTSTRFIAHLINQEVVHEVLGFQLIDLLINQPTPSSIEIVTDFVGECGAKLEQLNPSYLLEVFRTLREINLNQNFDTRTHELIDLLHLKRKDRFRDSPTVSKNLDLIEDDDRVTHTIELNDPKKEDFHLEYNYCQIDPKWHENEAKYEDFKKNLLGDNSSGDDEEEEESSSDGESGDSDSSGENEEEKPGEDKKPVIDQLNGDVKPEKIIDATGQDLIEFRKMVYLTLRSSLERETAVHKLLKSHIPPELREELCQMILDCCGQERTYERFLGQVASKFCLINRREYAPIFEKLFQKFYELVHNFEINKIRNLAKFYAHLLSAEVIDWSCMSCLKLREDATSSPGRCFIKFLFQELRSELSLKTLMQFIKEPSKEAGLAELFPKEPEQDTRFAINFFKFCELEELTSELVESLMARQ